MSLAEHIEDGLYPPDGDVEHRDRFVIDGPKTADWALRKLARIRGRIADNEALAAAEMARITEWLEAENGKLAHDVNFFEGLLTEYHRHVLADEPDRKTVALPGGKLVARKQPDRWEFGDDFVAWAQAHIPELVRVKVEPDRAAAKKHLTALGAAAVDVRTGEVVPGVTVEPGDVRFSVEVAP